MIIYKKKRLDTRCKYRLSRSKKRKIKYSIAAALLFIIVISTIQSTPLTSIDFEIKNFVILEENDKFRLCQEIMKEDPQKYLYVEDGPELLVAEMEKRLESVKPKQVIILFSLFTPFSSFHNEGIHF